MLAEGVAPNGPPGLLDLPQNALHQLASLLARGGGAELRTMCRSGRELANKAVTAAQVNTVGSCPRSLLHGWAVLLVYLVVNLHA